MLTAPLCSTQHTHGSQQTVGERPSPQRSCVARAARSTRARLFVHPPLAVCVLVAAVPWLHSCAPRAATWLVRGGSRAGPCMDPVVLLAAGLLGGVFGIRCATLPQAPAGVPARARGPPVSYPQLFVHACAHRPWGRSAPRLPSPDLHSAVVARSVAPRPHHPSMLWHHPSFPPAVFVACVPVGSCPPGR